MNNSDLQFLSGSTVLVTGATGFTGGWLTRKLVQGGLNVRAIARQSSDLSRFQGLPIEWFRGNVYDPDLINAAADGVQYIFHVAAAFREAKIPDSEYGRVHVDSTKLLAEAAGKNPSFNRFIHVSTMGVHGHIENPPGDENSPFAPGDMYQITKLEAEQWLREHAEGLKLPYVIIRPTAIYGPEDKRLLKLFKMATWPVFPILGSGRCLYHMIHVDDLSDAIIKAASAPNVLGEAFIIGNKEAIRLEDMLQIIARVYGRHPRTLRIPALPFFIAADICEFVCKPLGIEPPIYRRRVAFYTKDRSFNTDKMRNLLRYETQHSHEDGLAETARWYADQGLIRIPGWKASDTPNESEVDIRLQSNQ